MQKYITLGYLKKIATLSKPKLTINKQYEKLDDSVLVTYNDIESEKYFPLYKWTTNVNTDPRNIVVGFSIKGSHGNGYAEIENVSFIYTELIGGFLTSSDGTNPVVKSCGGELDIMTYGEFSIMEAVSNSISPIGSPYKVIINGDSCKLETETENHFKMNSHHVIVPPNPSNDCDIKATVSSKIMFRGKIVKQTMDIIQKANTWSDWKFDRKETTDVLFTCDSPLVVPSSGCVITFNTKRIYSSFYNKFDSCGNISEDVRIDKGLEEDVSKFCRIVSTNQDVFVRNSNEITVLPQEPENKARYCDVSVNYEGFSKQFTIKQEEGEKYNYSYSLSLRDGKKYQMHTMSNSLVGSTSFKIKSTIDKLLGGNIISSIINYDLYVETDESWCKARINKNSSDVELIIDVIEPNKSKHSERQCKVLVYYNPDEKENCIMIDVRQPKNRLVETKYTLEIEGSKYMTYEMLQEERFYFKPKREYVYEDGSSEEKFILEDGMTIHCECDSTNPEVAACMELNQIMFDGTHAMKPYSGLEKPYSDVYVDMIAYIKDKVTNKKISDNVRHKFVVKGIDKIENKHKFYFENEDKELSIKLNKYDDNVVEVPIVSLMDVFKNGLFDYSTKIPFECASSEGKIKYDFDSCDGKITLYKEDGITETVSDTFVFVQTDTEEKITLHVEHEYKPSVDICLIVNVSCENATDDIFSTDDLFIQIDEHGEFELQGYWLNEENKTDVVLETNLEFVIGKEYNFTTSGFGSSDLNEAYIFDETDTTLNLLIEI